MTISFVNLFSKENCFNFLRKLIAGNVLLLLPVLFAYFSQYSEQMEMEFTADDETEVYALPQRYDFAEKQHFYDGKSCTTIGYASDETDNRIRSEIPGRGNSPDQYAFDIFTKASSLELKSIRLIYWGFFSRTWNADAIAKSYRQEDQPLSLSDNKLLLKPVEGKISLVPNSTDSFEKGHFGIRITKNPFFFCCAAEIILCLFCLVSFLFVKKTESFDTKKNVFASLSVSVVLTAFVFLIVPLQSYLAQKTLFHFSTEELLLSQLPCFAMVSIVTAAFLFFSRKFFGFLPHLLILALAFYFYLEVGLLSAGLPPLNGQIDAYNVPARILVDCGVLCLILILPFCLYRFLKDYIPLAAVALCLLMCLSILDVKQDKGMDESAKKDNYTEMDRSIALKSIVYSPERNVFLLILDSISSEVAADVFRNSPELRNQFHGFVNYTDNIGMHESTMVAIPGIMTGEYFQSLDTLPRFLTTSFNIEKTFLTPYIRENIPVYVSLGLGTSSGYTNRPLLSAEYQNDSADEIIPPVEQRLFGSFCFNLKEISSFRLIPYCLKGQFLEKTMADFRIVQPKKAPCDDDRYCYNILKKAPVEPSSNLTLVVAHTIGAHDPCFFKRDGSPITNPEITHDYNAYFETTWYVLSTVGNFLNTLREKNIFDNATVIICADHGRPTSKIQTSPNLPPMNARPLLMVKPGKHNENYREDNSIPSSHTQISALLQSLENRNLKKEEIDIILSSNRRFYRYIADDNIKDWVYANTEKSWSLEKAKTETSGQDSLQPLELDKEYSMITHSNQQIQDDYPSFRLKNGSRTIFGVVFEKSHFEVTTRVPDPHEKFQFEYTFSLVSEMEFVKENWWHDVTFSHSGTDLSFSSAEHPSEEWFSPAKAGRNFHVIFNNVQPNKDGTATFSIDFGKKTHSHGSLQGLCVKKASDSE